MRGNITLKAKFAALLFFCFILTLGILYFATKKQLSNFLIDSNKENLEKIVQEIAEQNYDLAKPNSLKSENKHLEFAKRLKEIPHITQINILDSNGIVIYSDNVSEIGKDKVDSIYVKNAINGQSAIIVTEETKLADFYIPITSAEDSTKGIITGREIFDTLTLVKPFTFNLLLIVGGVSGAFMIVSFIIFSDIEKSMLEQDRSIIDQSKALEEERQLDEAIMSSIAESLVVINKNGQIMLFNPEAEKLTGLSSHNVEYRSYERILQFKGKDGKNISKNPISESLKTGKRVIAGIKDELYIRNSKKELIPVTVNVAPIKDKNEEIKGLVVTAQNVFAEKELQKVKDEFVYVVAHELGNPIFALDGYLTILSEMGRDKRFDKKTVEILESARGINNQLSNLVNELLEVSRNETGQLSFELEKIDLVDLIERAIMLNQFKSNGKKIEIDYKKTKLPKVIGNEQKIKEVLINFIDNSIKYTPQGGKIEISTVVSDGFVTTKILDNGIGMPKESLKHLFEKFYRVKSDKTKGITGTGLGLFITKQIIEKCGGKVWAESEDGKGSSFYFNLKKA